MKKGLSWISLPLINPNALLLFPSIALPARDWYSEQASKQQQ
jgi:hypothetical protein